MLLLMAAMMFWLVLLMTAVFVFFMALKKRLCDMRRGCVTRGIEERLGDLMI